GDRRRTRLGSASRLREPGRNPQPDRGASVRRWPRRGVERVGFRDAWSWVQLLGSARWFCRVLVLTKQVRKQRSVVHYGLAQFLGVDRALAVGFRQCAR